jgi:hypothetical protein
MKRITRVITTVLMLASLPFFHFGCACLVSDDPLYKEGLTPGDLGTFPGGCEEVEVGRSDMVFFDDAAFQRVYANLLARGVRNLNLTGTSITDKTLASVRTLETLTWLDVAATSVSPDGIRQLKAMPRLKQVLVGGPQFDDDTVKRLCHELRPLIILRLPP